MEEVTLEQIKRKFDSLPENLKLAIIVAGADKKINGIGREHGLNVKQIADLLLKTHIMMFGFIHPDKFEDSIKQILQIPPQVVRGIVRDVNEQIIKDIKDDLIALSEKPEKPEAVEGFIENETDLIEKEEIIETPKIEEVVEKFEPIILENKMSATTKENEKDTEILKSAGIEIEILPPNTTLKQDQKTENVAEKEKTEKENKDVLMSAGIEITPLSFGNEIKTKTDAPINIEKTNEEKQEEKQENEEIKKIAFENLPKNTIGNINKKEDIKKTEIINDSTFIPKEKETVKISSVPREPLELENKEIKEISAPLLLELEEGDKIEILPKEKPKQVVREVNKDVYEEQKVIPPAKNEAVPLVKIEDKVDLPIKKKGVEKTESIDESAHIPEEKKKFDLNKNLKIATKNIIDFYERKNNENQISPKDSTYTMESEQKIDTEEIKIYKNPEKEKKVLVMQIVEIQEKMKTLKDRLSEIEKERNKLDINTDKNKNSELFIEEKTIQKIREFDLPKDYLDSLDKLDKMTSHKTNPPLK